ncbi:hypothetical protein GCM10023189_24190 [Nibrella saemangeumensis]|uniref:histidine kinase n=1 Tax=Nibrella saemangeumensis TaxID=1084526 RepID=A0ABP8MWX7_9BACT
MKRLLLLIVLFGHIAFAQTPRIDSLRQLLAQTRTDTGQVWVLAQLGNSYRVVSPDSGLYFAQQALTLSRKIGFVKGEVRALTNLGRIIQDQGNLPKALQYQFDALKLAQENNLPDEMDWPLNRLGSINNALGNHQQARQYYYQALRIFRAKRNEHDIAIAQSNIAYNFIQLNQPDSALAYADSAYRTITRLRSSQTTALQLVLNVLGRCYVKKKQSDKALYYFRKGIQASIRQQDHRNSSQIYINIAYLYRQHHQPDSCFYYARKALDEANEIGFTEGVLHASTLLAEYFRQRRNFEQAFGYQQMMIGAQDSLFGKANVHAVEQIIINEQNRQREIQAQAMAYQNRIERSAFAAGLAVVLLVAFFLYRNNRQKHQANKLLGEQKAKVEQTLTTLKATQAQLIQREKMASLGELTAGIAHEIQNPLNFVNNLSEVSTELVEELEEEIKAGHTQDALDLTGDLRETLEKVNHHGKRADGIVKGMLQHSKTSRGTKEPTDLNALADEYLRLAYQNLRAKDDSFTADLRLNLDSTLGLVNITPQDMGRVLLNLYNNAFYAVQEKQKLTHNGRGTNAYKPQIEVTTHRENGRVELQVKDNGTGIPEEIVNKIFQPFFTTKPTGQGTGLGLSLSYDIVTKGHGGEMRVDTQTGEFTEFVIALPA